MTDSIPDNYPIFLNDDPELTPIQKFYDGKNVFITGVTGFLGKILLEKLLRSCPTVSSIYVMVRSKKGKNLTSRIDELFDDVIFDRLKEAMPKFRHKVVGVGGDCALPDLGLNMQDRQMLINEIHVIMHVAATVRFDEKLKQALAINVRAPQDMIKMAKEMPNLKVMMHVSTAYSQCVNSTIEERLYSPPIDSKKMLQLGETMPEKILDNITPTILDKFPNTYAYTKALAEDIVNQEGQGLPIGIFRPAIVISTYKEPIKGWINNLYGPTGVCAGAGTGLIRVLHCDANVNANVVPVDMCVNSLIAASWEVAENFEKRNNKEAFSELPVYHFESSNDQPINWGKFMSYAESSGITHPSLKSVWYYCLTLQKYRILYLLATFFIHTIPALLTDAVFLCIGKQPRLLKVYRKIHKFTNVISYFCTRSWTFESKRVQQLVSKMSKKDNDIFLCDLKLLNWEMFFHEYLKGIRIHLLMDPLDTLPEARQRFKRLFYLHQGIKIIFGFVCFRIIWSSLCYIFSNIL